MRYAIATLVLLAACASAQPSQQSEPAPRPEFAEDHGGPLYADARAVASDAEVRDARRAYRAACQTRRSEAYCECMTGGMAQALPPSDLAIATAAFTSADVQASQEARDRVARTRAEVERGCSQYR